MNIKYSDSISDFRFPFIAQENSQDSVASFLKDRLSNSSFKIAHKSLPTDTINIALNGRDTSIWRDLFRNTNDSIFKNLSYDGFEVKTDYSSTVYNSWHPGYYLFPYYPIYIINRTSIDKFFPGKDSHAFGIQEALDSNEIWRPIEGQGFDFCGNGYWQLKIRPKEFLTIIAPKYDGDYKTKLRVRLKIGNMVYVSKAFDGVINYKQFFIEKKSYFFDCLKEDRTSTIQDIFYGAQPLQVKKNRVVSHAVVAQQP